MRGLRAPARPPCRRRSGQERAVNPFLRTRLPALRQAAQAFNGAPADDDVAVFAAIRQWKNEYR
jgi:hydroxyacylglutathione hydrolase